MRRTGRSSFLARVTRLLTNARRARVSHHQPAARRTKLDRGQASQEQRKDSMPGNVRQVRYKWRYPVHNLQLMVPHDLH